jgi:hypothetical protein
MEVPAVYVEASLAGSRLDLCGSGTIAVAGTSAAGGSIAPVRLRDPTVKEFPCP